MCFDCLITRIYFLFLPLNNQSQPHKLQHFHGETGGRPKSASVAFNLSLAFAKKNGNAEESSSFINDLFPFPGLGLSLKQVSMFVTLNFIFHFQFPFFNFQLSFTSH